MIWLDMRGDSQIRSHAGVQRSFKSFSAAANEATLSRIFAGVHFRSDLTSGQQFGSEVAHFVVDNFFSRLDQDDESDDH